MHIGGARDGCDPPLQLPGDAQIVFPVVADGTHVDLRRNTEVEDLGHHVGGLEKNTLSGKAAGRIWRSLPIYVAVGAWPSFRDTRITPSLTPIAVPSPKA